MKLTKESEKLTDLKTLKGTKVFPNVKDANVPESIQRKLTAGKNITIDNNVISATDQQPDLSGYQKKLTAGTGIEITSSNVINNTQPSPDLSGYQKKLTAGENIVIRDNVISATGDKPPIKRVANRIDEKSFAFDKPITNEEVEQSNGIIVASYTDDLGTVEYYLYTTVFDEMVYSFMGYDSGTKAMVVYRLIYDEGITGFELLPLSVGGDSVNFLSSDLSTMYDGTISADKINVLQFKTGSDPAWSYCTLTRTISDLGFFSSVDLSDDDVSFTEIVATDGKIGQKTCTLSKLCDVKLFSTTDQSLNLLLTSYTHTITIDITDPYICTLVIETDLDSEDEITTLPGLTELLGGYTYRCTGVIADNTFYPYLAEVTGEQVNIYYEEANGTKQSFAITASEAPTIVDRVRSHKVQVKAG